RGCRRSRSPDARAVRALPGGDGQRPPPLPAGGPEQQSHRSGGQWPGATHPGHMSQRTPATMALDIPVSIGPRATSGPAGAHASKARLVIAAVSLETRPVTEVAAPYGVSRSWIYELLARYRDEGDAAFQPHSRAPKTSPAATPPETVELVLRLRKDLLESGHD